MTSGSSTMSPTRMRGFSDEYGSWKTICMSRRAWRIRSATKRSTFSPLNSTSPDVGSISRRMQRPVVVLPLPDSPTRPNVSPVVDREAHVVHRAYDRRRAKEPCFRVNSLTR